MSIIYIEEESYATGIGKVIKDTVNKYNWIRSMRINNKKINIEHKASQIVRESRGVFD